MSKSLFRRMTAVALSLLVGWTLAAQQRVTISGVVTDDQNEPMIAAGVVQKGTTNGTITDLDGSFTLTVPAGSVIEFSSVGYVTQEYVATKTEKVTIKMAADTQMIEETVVVGYGVQRKSDVTGAISQVKSEDNRRRAGVLQFCPPGRCPCRTGSWYFLQRFFCSSVRCGWPPYQLHLRYRP